MTRDPRPVTRSPRPKPDQLKPSRTSFAARNILWGNLSQLVILGLQFANRTVFIYTIGIVYLGLNSLFLNVIGVLSLAELGIASALNYSLYKPVAQGDTERLKSLMLLFKKVYRVIALVVLLIGLGVMPFLEVIIKDAEGVSIGEIQIFFSIFLFKAVVSYLLTYKFSIVVAHQRNYLITNTDTVVRMLTMGLQIYVLVVYESFLGYLLIQAGFQLVYKVLMVQYINRLYPYLREKQVAALPAEEYTRIKSDIKALFVHKIATVSTHQSSAILISAFINISTVGIVSNYNLLLMSVTAFLTVIFTNILASLGNLIATESAERQLKVFNAYNFTAFWLYGFTTACFILLVQPFIALWIGEENQIGNLPMLIFFLNQYFTGFRVAMNNFKIAGGIFKQDVQVPLVQAVVNIVLGIVLIYYYDLTGLFLATLIQGLIANFWRPVIVYRILFNMSAAGYFMDALRYTLIFAFALILTGTINHYLFDPTDAVQFGLMTVLTAVLVNLAFLIFLAQTEEFQLVKSKITGLIGRS